MLQEWLLLAGIGGLICVPVGAIGVAARAEARSRRAALLAAWHNAAQDLGLELGRGQSRGMLRLYGQVDGFDVVVDTAQDSNVNIPVVDVTRFQVFGRGRIPRSLRIYPLVDSRLRPPDAPRVLIDSPDVDRAAAVYGDELEIRALLDAGARRAVAAAARRWATVQKESVYLVEAGHISDALRIVGRVRELLALAAALSLEQKQVGARLLENAAKEAELGARRWTFRALFERMSDSEESKRGRELAAGDPDPLIRLYAALSGREPPPLPAIELLLLETSPADRPLALAHLTRRATGAELIARLAEMVADESAGVQRQVLQAALLRRSKSLLPVLLAAGLRGERDPLLAPHLLEALEAIGDPRAEPVLLRMLEQGPVELRSKAAHALGRAGTLLSIEPLRKAGGLMSASRLRQECRAAIAAIRARQGNPEAGRLSVVAESEVAGALSVTEGDGALSWPDDRRPA